MSRLDFKDGFAMVPKAAIHDKRISRQAKVMLFLLASYADGNGECYPSIGTMGEALDASESTIRRLIGELAAAGYVLVQERKTEDGRNRSNLYQVVWQVRRGSVDDTLPSHQWKGEGVTGDRGEGVTDDTQNNTTKNNTIRTTPSIPTGEAVFDLTAETHVRKPHNDVAEEFEAVWKTYPLKKAKGAALRSYTRARKTVSRVTIEAGLKILVHNETVAKGRQAPNLQFFPHFSTWLNQERWTDERQAAEPAVKAFPQKIHGAMQAQGNPYHAELLRQEREQEAQLREEEPELELIEPHERIVDMDAEIPL